jgi:hypothetical protein
MKPKGPVLLLFGPALALAASTAPAIAQASIPFFMILILSKVRYPVLNSSKELSA